MHDLPLFSATYQQYATEHMLLAKAEALRFSTKAKYAGIDIEDLIAQSYLLLLEACRCYHSSVGAPLDAYLRICLRRGLNKYIQANSLISFHTHLKGHKLSEARRKIKIVQLPEEIADKRKYDPCNELIQKEEIQRLKKLLRRKRSRKKSKKPKPKE